MISSRVAKRLGTGFMFSSMSTYDVERPAAPARTASCRTLHMRSISSCVAARSCAAAPIT
jgi:hypothetical protein